MNTVTGTETVQDMFKIMLKIMEKKFSEMSENNQHLQINLEKK
jgi:hypothetical protein